MTVSTFAHGTYGDDAGVTFYGPHKDGFNSEYLMVSDRYISPIFATLISRGTAPKFVTEWSQCDGWMDAEKRARVADPDVVQLAQALTDFIEEQVAPHCEGTAPDQCVKCAAVMRAFLLDLAGRGEPVFIERD